jgi:hypothetical protein
LKGIFNMMKSKQIYGFDSAAKRAMAIAGALAMLLTVCPDRTQAGDGAIPSSASSAVAEGKIIYQTDFKTKPFNTWGNGNAGTGDGEFLVGKEGLYNNACMVFANPFALTNANKFKLSWQINSLGSADAVNPKAQLRFVIAPSPIQAPEPYNLPSVMTVIVTRDGSKLTVSVYEKVDGKTGFGASLYSGESTVEALPLKVSLTFSRDSYEITLDKPFKTAAGSNTGRLAIGRAEAFAKELATGILLVNLDKTQAKAVIGALTISELAGTSQ